MSGLECPICLQMCSDMIPSRYAILLSTCHDWCCERCIQELIRGSLSDYIYCPKCNKKSRIPEEGRYFNRLVRSPDRENTCK